MALLPLSEEQVLDRLKQENPWWATGQIDEDYTKMQRRLYFDLFYPLVEDISIKRAGDSDGPKKGRKNCNDLSCN
jgi:hypothetical protein